MILSKHTHVKRQALTYILFDFLPTGELTNDCDCGFVFLVAPLDRLPGVDEIVIGDGKLLFKL